MFLMSSITAFNVLAQDKKMPSPPAKAEATVEGVAVTIDYHQPSAKGRKIMGALVPYKEVWRTGANAKVEGQAIAKGKYGLYTIPGEEEWTIIINSGIAWGAYDYSDKKDVLRVKVKPSKTAAFVETFTIAIENGNVVLKWENTSVSFKISKG